MPTIADHLYTFGGLKVPSDRKPMPPREPPGTQIRIKATISADGPGFESSESCETAEQLLEAAVHHAMQVHGFGETKEMATKFIGTYRSDYLGYGKPKPPAADTPNPVA